jgi:hypothetical protein
MSHTTNSDRRSTTLVRESYEHPPAERTVDCQYVNMTCFNLTITQIET